MNEYEKLKAELEKKRCKACGGSGVCDDADLGDIFFRTWKCPNCNGTGLLTISKKENQ